MAQLNSETPSGKSSDMHEAPMQPYRVSSPDFPPIASEKHDDHVYLAQLGSQLSEEGTLVSVGSALESVCA